MKKHAFADNGHSKSLSRKRAEEQAYAEQLRRDEERKFAEQTQKLAEMRHMLDTEVQDYAARYQKNPDQVFDFAKGRLDINDTQILSELKAYGYVWNSKQKL